MARILPISDVKTRLPELVTDVEDRAEEIIVTRKGRPAAIILNFEEYESLQATLEILSDPAAKAQIRRSRAYFVTGGKGLTVEEVFESDRPKRRQPRK
ncbi:MAG: type II toxin-antitoxin system Phd/YefM family antitoxin [Candidatus Binatia bacterium]